MSEEISNDLSNIIILNDDTGNEMQFEFLDLIEYMGNSYVVLLPIEECDNTGEVVILKLNDSDIDGEENYSSVESSETLEVIFHIFKHKFKDTFNFAGED